MKFAALESRHPVTVQVYRGSLVRRNVKRRPGDGAPVAYGMRRNGGMVLYAEDEGTVWARGWKGDSVDLLRVAAALAS